MIKHAVKTPIGWMTHYCRGENCPHRGGTCIHVDTKTYRYKAECEWYWTHSYANRYIPPTRWELIKPNIRVWRASDQRFQLRLSWYFSTNYKQWCWLWWNITLRGKTWEG